AGSWCKAMRKSETLFRYSLAIVAAFAALWLRYLLTPLLGTDNPYHTAWLAVVFAAWYCGIGPAIVATVILTLGVDYWFLPPFGSFAIQDRTQSYGILGFVACSIAIIALGESNRRGFGVRARLAAIVESSDDAIISKNLDGIITSWNKGAERVFGYTEAEAVGKHITMIIPPEHRDEEVMILERLRRGERIEHFETVRMRKDGTTLDVSLTISPVKDAVGLVIGASKVARDITERRQAEVAIKEKELSARLLKLQDEERRRIARELHDGVGQLLAAMSMNTGRLNLEKAKLSPEGARCLEDNSRLVQQISSDIRTMSYLFHPPLLDEMGLGSALKWYVQGFTERSKISTTLELTADGERLLQDYELCLFRIAQECLTNIHRHSGSSVAVVRLLRTDREIKLEVSDEGVGISAETQSKIAAGETAGVGLRGMRERLRQLGGRLQISSNGKGTTVTATVPYVEAERSAESLPEDLSRASEDGHPGHGAAFRAPV
ncbi:MAG: PAS domain S-box protein, partial [Candidatus Acidiferrales bacterium]